MSRPDNRLSLRIASVCAVFGLLLAASTALSWATFEAVLDAGDERQFAPVTVTGLAGPFGMGGKFVAGLGALAAAAGGCVVFTRGRGYVLTASRWLAYCGGFFVLALYFLVRAWLFDQPVEGVIQTSSAAVSFVKQANLTGLTLALVLGVAGALTALAGSFISRRRPARPG